jgi:chemotaxis protein methyltransferase CheR
MKDILTISEEDFLTFQQFLVEESGLYFDKDKMDTLRRAIWERVRKKGYDSYKEYYNFLKFHPEGRIEIRHLLDLLTIGETYFFRNKPHFEALMRSVLPDILAKKNKISSKSLKVWSSGCSKGDEAYSIAIAVMEVMPDFREWDLTILGTDINRQVLSSAREAIYGRRDVASMPEEYIAKYFQKRGAYYTLEPSVKDLVHFENHNLAKDPFVLEGMQACDIIFCRNVMIYFDVATMKRVLDNFYDCLLDDGYLFLGDAEILWQITNKFESVEFPQTFVYKKAMHPVDGSDLRPFMAVPEINLQEFEPLERAIPEVQEAAVGAQEVCVPAPPSIKIDSYYKKAMQSFKDGKYDEALSILNEIISQDKNYILAYLAKANILANQAQYKEAIGELKNIIEVDNLYVETYYLLGVLAYKTGDLKEAEEQFKKVVYIDPKLELAYFNLGNLYLYQKAYAKAAHEFNNAIKLLISRPLEEPVRLSENFTVDFLLRTCKNSLEEIKRKNG